MKNYYIDMDGVLAKYDKTAYVGEDPLYMQKNQHYFRNLEPDRKMLEFIDILHKRCRYTGDNVYILTTLPINGAIFNEQFHDKIAWINEWLPYMSIDNILISVTSKRDAVEYIHNHSLSQSDILIDDYNKNLLDWQNAGGTSVKYCNGINSPASFSGIKLFCNDTAAEMFQTLSVIWRKETMF